MNKTIFALEVPVPEGVQAPDLLVVHNDHGTLVLERLGAFKEHQQAIKDFQEGFAEFISDFGPLTPGIA